MRTVDDVSAVLAAISAGVVVQDASGAIVAANRAAEQVLGQSLEQLRGVTSADERWQAVHEDGSPFPGEEHPAMVCLRTGEPVNEVLMGLPAAGGGRRWLSIDARPIPGPAGRPGAVVTTFRDVTERRLLQDQLAANARLAAMATLVGGVAHEVNNPLAVVAASRDWATETLSELRAELAAGSGPDTARLLERVDEVLSALRETQAGVARIAGIVRDLKLIGRPEPVRHRADLAAVVARALRWIPPPLAARARISRDDLGAPPVLAAEGQLELVVINLVTNALQSIAPGRTGAVRVRVGPGRAGAARLEVIDDGVGMSREVASRIFDPFFTTREVGQGLGLGLTVAHSIVATHGGLLDVESAPGAGSIFRAELPAAPPEPGR